MKTICYLRVSSPKRNGKSRQKTDSQKLALKAYCRTQGIRRPTYIEDHATGRNQDRPGFQSVIDACRQGKCEQLVIWKLDRIGRSMIEVVRTIRELMTLKIRIVVTTQGFTFDESPYSIFLIQLFACLSELESNHCSERIKSGLSVARSKGVKLGRKNDDRKRAKLLRWEATGVTVKEQSRRLKVSTAAVYAMRKRIHASNDV